MVKRNLEGTVHSSPHGVLFHSDAFRRRTRRSETVEERSNRAIILIDCSGSLALTLADRLRQTTRHSWYLETTKQPSICRCPPSAQRAVLSSIGVSPTNNNTSKELRTYMYQGIEASIRWPVYKTSEIREREIVQAKKSRENTSAYLASCASTSMPSMHTSTSSSRSASTAPRPSDVKAANPCDISFSKYLGINLRKNETS